MNQKSYLFVCGTVFLVVAAIHLLRLVLGWEISIGGWIASYWVSVVGLIIAGALSVWGFTLASRLRPVG